MNLIRRSVLAAAAALALAGASSLASAQTKWDLPSAYPANNFHTENLVQFAADVDKATGGKLKITVHSNASLFKAPEIKRAVQGGQAQMGEILLVNFENEWPIFGVDGLPFLADSYAGGDEALQGAEAVAREEARRAGHHAALQRGLAAAGHLRQEADPVGGRPEGRQVARLQPGHRAHRRTGRRAAGDDPAGRAVAGDGHRRDRELHVVGLDRRSTPRPTSTSSTSTTPRPGCRRTRCWSTRRRSTRSTSRPRPRC